MTLISALELKLSENHFKTIYVVIICRNVFFSIKEAYCVKVRFQFIIKLFKVSREQGRGGTVDEEKREEEGMEWTEVSPPNSFPNLVPVSI